MLNKIIVIGRLDHQDVIILDQIAISLLKIDKTSWANDIIDGNYTDYDMTLLPALGDAIDHIKEETELVIGLHLYGIDQIPNNRNLDQKYFYNRNNGELLAICMDRGVNLICWGDQPWLKVESKIKLDGCGKAYFYQPWRHRNALR